MGSYPPHSLSEYSSPHGRGFYLLKLAIGHSSGRPQVWWGRAEVCRPTSRISDWTPYVQRTIADLKPTMTVGRVHFMPIQIAACE